MTRRSARPSTAAITVALAALAGALAATLAPVRGQERDALRTPIEHRRPADNTYLTYPEWFLVFSPAEYADYVEEHAPSDFPFLGHVAQLWEGYGAVASAIPDDQPFNLEYHTMVVVIATSTTVEYAIRALYETVIGTVSEATVIGSESRRGGLTDEDRYGAAVARDYERFLRQRPWYLFDYAGALGRLWTEVPIAGPDPIRKLERRYALSSEYLAKHAYAWLLRAGAEATYGVAGDTTAIVLDRAPADLESIEGVEVLERFEDGAVLALAPRYEAFGAVATALAERGVVFLEIAGNDGTILVSAIVPTGWSAPTGRELLRQPVLTRPGHERLLLDVPVPSLSSALRALAPTHLEHVFDY